MDGYKIILPFPPSSNTAYPTVRTGRSLRRIKSDALKKWQTKAQKALHGVPEIKDKVNIIYLMYFPDNRQRDGQNYMKAPLDLLVQNKILQDDNRNYVAAEAWQDKGTNKENPRIEIIIKPVNNV